jgi:hypothetical protein
MCPASPRVDKILSAKGSEADRSKKILEFYITEILKPQATDPLEDFNYEITDGPRDGGLDAFAIDGEDENPTVHLLQSKWFDSPGRLDERTCLDLHNFIVNKLQKRETTELNEAVKKFIGLFHTRLRRPVIIAHYITNGELHPAAVTRYDELESAGIAWHLVDKAKLEKLYFDALSGEEPINNEIVFSLNSTEFFQRGFAIPADLGGGTCLALQFALNGLDLRRASDLYSRRLFTRNLRFSLKKSEINQRIVDTAEGVNKTLFYVLHNGVSITAEEMRILNPSDRSTLEAALQSDCKVTVRANLEFAKEAFDRGTRDFVFLRNFQIVNGAQSTVALGQVSDGNLKDVTLPAKITQSSNAQLAALIAYCNNSQNKIGMDDLIANSAAQVLLQNYAALEVEPPVFYSRKKGETWKDIYRAVNNVPPIPAPDSLREIDYVSTYQAFLAFMGRPAQAYTSPRSMIYPGKPFYGPITDHPDKDELVMAGLLLNYEDSLKGSRGDPEFATYWRLWALALAGHFYRERLSSDAERIAAKRSLLGKKGLDRWKAVRKSLIAATAAVLSKNFPAVSGKLYLNFFRADDDVFELKGFRAVTPGDCNAMVDPKIRGATLMDMRRAADPNVLGKYEVPFAVLAVLFDKHLSANPAVAAALRAALR